ncbi:MAG: hypothetical protein JW913_09930 [Chitinispirillaceae bacterium]|nr:hypothetical protein [Chitinispirillaceae bacterium]
MSTEHHTSLPQKTAEQLLRLFNVVFNSAMLYGGSHPTTLKSIEPFFESLSKALAAAGMISLVVDRESLFLEEWPADRIINTRRLLQQFGKSGIVSITFEKGIAHNDIELLIRYAGNSTAITPVEQIRQVFRQSGCTGIKLNYVHYGKITNDQAVVGKNNTGAAAGPAHGAPVFGTGERSLQQLEEVLSLARLFEHPEQSAAAFSKTALDPETTDEAVRSLAGLRSSIHLDNAPSVDLLLNAVYELKVDLQEAIAVQKETGKLLASTEPLNDEMDNLTCDVIIKLVREEYGSGGIPMRRMAEIIRRMLPDSNELKRLLPRLKPALLDAGMSLPDYLQLIRTLNIEFESESLAGTLQEAASGIGASVDELVNAIRSQPDDAARLLVMASEIRKGTKEDDAQLSSMLTEYIEKVSTSFALGSRELSGSGGGSTVLKQMLGQLEGQLLDNLKKYGVEEPVLVKVGGLLAQRLDSVFDKAAAQWITTELDTKPHLTPQELSEQLVRLVGEQAQLDRLHDPVMAALTARGFDKEQMENLLKKLAGRIAAGKMFKLPPGILSANNMQFLLDREIKQHQRYKTPFASLMVTIEGLSSDGASRRPSDDETVTMLPKIFSLVKHVLRDIDLVGSLDVPDEKAAFALLTMTDGAGAKIARGRIIKKIDTIKMKIGNNEMMVIVAASTAAPDAEVKYTMKSYLELVRRSHAEAVGAIAGPSH